MSSICKELANTPAFVHRHRIRTPLPNPLMRQLLSSGNEELEKNSASFIRSIQLTAHKQASSKLATH